jgi:hypothetical protein
MMQSEIMPFCNFMSRRKLGDGNDAAAASEQVRD